MKTPPPKSICGASVGLSSVAPADARCQLCGAQDVIVDCKSVPSSFSICDFCASCDASLQRSSSTRVQLITAIPPRIGDDNLVDLRSNGDARDHGPGWRMLAIPPDGDCLFTAMVVCRYMLANRPLPSCACWPSLGRLCRKIYLEFLERRVRENTEFMGVADMATLLHASAGLTPDAFMSRMRTGVADDRKTWGGFLDIAILCQRWQCQAHLYKFVSGGLRRISWVGLSQPSAQQHRHGICSLVWGGGHYSALDVSDDALLRPPARLLSDRFK